MIKKYLDGSHLYPEWLLKYSSRVEYVEDSNPGYVALIHMDEVDFTFPVDYDDSGKCLIDNGYKCFIYMPMKENWCLSIFMNDQYDIIEWYFDMTKENEVENGKPYFIDLYLDIAVSPCGTVVVLDEDELMDAYNEGIISASDVDMAKANCEKLLTNHIPNKEWLYSFIDTHLVRLKENIS